MTTLRSKLIRLAHENPSLRDHLLPVVRTASGTDLDVMVDVTGVTSRGTGLYLLKGSYRAVVTVDGRPFTTSERFSGEFSHDGKTWSSNQATFSTGLVLSGLARVSPDSFATQLGEVAVDNFRATWGGGHTVTVGFTLAQTPTPDQLLSAAKSLVAELNRVDIKELLWKNALKLKGPKSITGPKRPTIRDVRVGSQSESDDKRWIYVVYEFYELTGMQAQGRLDISFQKAYRAAGGRF